MKPGIIEKHFLDKHEEGVPSSEFNNLGSVQSCLGDDFPKPDPRFVVIEKPVKKTKKSKKLNSV